MPVLIVSENTSPHVGFSRNRSIVPSSRGDDDAELDRVLDPLQRDRRERARRRGAPSTTAPRSMSVSTSPEMTRNVSSSSSIALRTEPAVPSGDSSVA